MFIVDKMPKSIEAESYRALRTNIQYSSIDKKLKVIVVTSSEPNEGKTTVSGNIACVLAQNNSKTLLIDCDFRNPNVNKRLGISNENGLSEVLIGNKDKSEVITRINKNLSALTTGKIPPNPSEMIGSNTMKELLKSLKDEYDYIIVDTPPLLVVTDGQLLAANADGTILVVKAEKTKQKQLMEGKKALEIVKANIIGVVLNGISKKVNKYYGYYKYEENNKRKRKK
ncbi:CpsD/CapB family tyrosine-protein kinase [Clostridium tarantellae]|uniref:non-specific protein-tyrosine kinase n=1 Tax=Clostridium tarantellae TaxID=39493 RepID=A0A6I1MK18_9CLOT|nr:CpsD/CapB family tyrosine-protein kinase [Clostridium tarantellae]MPQ43063.1 polysaccharide biosynthesis tyrosine autokinase [Clostridium tarantellae]